MARGVQVFVQVIDRTALIGGMVHAQANRSGREAAYAARDKARELVPVLSGALHDSIEVTRLGAGEYELSAGDDEVDYAAAVEFGTYRMSAIPYFTPAVEHGRQVMMAAPSRTIWRGGHSFGSDA